MLNSAPCMKRLKKKKALQIFLYSVDRQCQQGVENNNDHNDTNNLAK